MKYQDVIYEAPHINAEDINLFKSNPFSYYQLMGNSAILESHSCRFVVDTTTVYDELDWKNKWKTTLSKELVTLGIKEGQAIYINSYAK